MALIQTVHLSMANFKSAPVVPAVQNDTDRQVKMIIDDYTLTSGLTGKIAFERSDGTHYETAAELVLVDNAFVADIDQALTQPGRTMVQLKVTDTLTVSTFSFVIFVEADNSGTVTPQEGIDLITAVEAAESAADRAESAAETLELDAMLTSPTKAAQAKAVGDEINDLKTQLTNYNSYNILALYGSHANTSNNGVRITWTDDENCTIVTPTATTGYPRFNLISSVNSLPSYFTAGNEYQILFESNDPNIYIEIQPYVNGTGQASTKFKGNATYMIPNTANGILVRIWCDSNSAVYNATAFMAMLPAKSNGILTTDVIPIPFVRSSVEEYNSHNILYFNVNHSTTSNNGVQIVWTDPENCTIKTPSSTTGYPRFNVIESLSSIPSFITPGKKYYIKFKSNDSDIRFEIYPYIGGEIQSGVMFTTDGEYTVPSNISGITFRLWCNNNTKSYNASVYLAMLDAPTNSQLSDMISEIDGITRLISTGDTTDRTAEIEAILSANGVCFLGKGVFYTTGVSLGWGQELVGMGKSTELRLADSVTNGAVITMGSQSSVRDLAMRGISNSVTVSSTVGTRHGILIVGNADGAADNIPVKMTIDNVFISRLNGGGIECKNTGLSKGCYLSATNVHIYNCDAGIDVSYYSEFNHFTNIMAEGCYYGCVNNGGNNVFVNCDFSRNKMGMLMDNSASQSPNNSHGSVIGCLFNHSDSNNGYGIKILNCPNGFVFDGCQIFYSQIYIEDSDGIIISNSNFGSSNCDITIDEGGAILFIGDMFQADPTITITDNASVHFVNCYVRSTGVAVEPN